MWVRACRAAAESTCISSAPVNIPSHLITNSRAIYYRRTSCGADGDSNGVLAYAQVEAGAVHYDMQPVSLDDVLTTCDALVAPQVRHRNLALAREPCDPALTVRADREKLQQIVLNLLFNAIKFTRAGGQIMLRCACGADRDGSLLQIVVTDTGIGIEPSQLARIFEPFVQVNTELTRTREGSRPWTRHQPRPRARHGWRSDGGERTGTRQRVHAHAAFGVARGSRCSAGTADKRRSTADETKYIYRVADVRQPAAG